MKRIRLISATIFTAIYLIFLSWYNGWGIDPFTDEEIRTLASKVQDQPNSLVILQMLEDDDGGEFFMLNLNRYEYAENEPHQGVPASYQAYGMAVIRLLLKRASHPIFSGDLPNFLLNGNIENETWDEVILVRYRSKRDFISMVTSDEYLEVFSKRTGGIEYATVTPSEATINMTTPRFIVLIFLALLGLFVDRLIKRRGLV